MMVNHILRYKRIIIIASIIIFAISSWYFLSNRNFKDTPQSADFVMKDIFVKNTERYNGR